MARRFILHTADIHIGSGLRSKEYRTVFDELSRWINNFEYKNDLMILIAGDIFHHKNRYSGEDVDDFNYLMDKLSGYPVIIIPGNHDAALNDHNMMDLITPLVSNRANVHYWKNSGHYELGHKFYHLSVFDETADATALIKNDPNFADIIFLYHGMINGAVFGKHTAADTRITADVVNGVKLLLAGDIHQQQFITPTAAYCGSLIQQNLGESMEKGFLLWDVDNRKASFIQIHNHSGFLRIDLRGKNNWKDEVDKLAGKNCLLKVSLLTDGNDAMSETQINAVKEKFGRLDRVSRQVETLQINPVEDITETIFKMLLNKEVDDELAENIINQYAEQIHTVATNKWTITRMSWDNLFKYGKGNVIDFTKLEGVTGVVAPNRAGKSSIIDILVFALFGEHLRGDRKTIVRHGTTESRVRVDFIVNNVQYYIERVEVENKHNHSSVKLFRHDDNWVNITGVNISATYATIRSLIGSSTQFLSTGLYYDDQYDIIKQSKSDRMKTLPELFGMIDNNSIIQKTRIQLRAVKEKIDKITRPRPGVAAEYDAVSKNVLDANNTRNNLITLRNTMTDAITKIRDKIKFGSFIDDIERDIIEKSALASRCEAVAKTIVVEPIEYAVEIVLSVVERKQYNADIAAAASLQPSSYYKSDSERVTDALVDVGKLIKEQTGIQEWLKSTKPDSVNNKYEFKSTSEIDDELRLLKLYNINDNLITTLQSDINKIKSQSGLKFDDTCKCCINNKQILAKDLADKETHLSNEVAKRENALRANEKISNRIQELVSQRDTITANNNHYITQKDLSLNIENKKLRLSIINTEIAQQNEANALQERIRQAKINYQIALKGEIAQERLSNANKYEQYILYKKKCELTSKVAVLLQEVAELNQSLGNSYTQNDIDILNKCTSELDVINDNISTIDHQIGQDTGKLEFIAKEILITNEYNTNYPPLEAEYKAKKAFIDCLLSSELKMTIIKKNIDKVILYANELLATLTDFTIQSDITDTTIDLYLIEYNNPKLPIGMASKFQKCVVSIVLRISLTTFLPSGTLFMIIDEGFGGMDNANLDNLPELFTQIAEQFNFLFIISHLDKLQNMLTRPINIIPIATDAVNGADQIVKNTMSYINNTVDIANALTAPNEIKENNVQEYIDNLVEQGQRRPELLDGMILCVCGRTIRKRSLATHMKSIKHNKRMTDRL